MLLGQNGLSLCLTHAIISQSQWAYIRDTRETVLRAGLINNASCNGACLFVSYRRRWQRYERVIDHCLVAWAKCNRSALWKRYPRRLCHSTGLALHRACPEFPDAIGVRSTKKDHRTVGHVRISTATEGWVRISSIRHLYEWSRNDRSEHWPDGDVHSPYYHWSDQFSLQRCVSFTWTREMYSVWLKPCSLLCWSNSFLVLRKKLIAEAYIHICIW